MSAALTLPAARHRLAEIPGDFPLDCGQTLPGLTIAYETAGTLNAEKSNAVLICHALTGDQYVAVPNPVTGRTWWPTAVGPGRALDTDRLFVVCANVLGGCMGTSGPLTPRPDGTPWGPDFPPVTIDDMARAHHALLAHLGIARVMAVIGGSMGGMQALAFAAHFPDATRACVPIATAAAHSAQNIAFHEVGRQAIGADPDFCDGRYAEAGRFPARGLAVARMCAHITYLSEAALTRKFGRRLQNPAAASALLGDIFEVESYLRYQGSSFVDRFDANSYLAITRAMDHFDLAFDHRGDLTAAFADTPVQFCLVSFSSDWLFPTAQSRDIARALNRAGANVSFVEIASDKGHDAFLLDEPDFFRTLGGFVGGVAKRAGC